MNSYKKFLGGDFKGRHIFLDNILPGKYDIVINLTNDAISYISDVIIKNNYIAILRDVMMPLQFE